MKIIKIWFLIFLFVIALASTLPHLFPNFWLIDIFSHFKLQYVLLLMFLLLPFAIYQGKKYLFPILFILLLITWNSWFIAPLYIEDRTIVENTGESLSILSMNLLASNTNYSEAIDLINEKNPDIVILLELSPAWSSELEELYTQFPFRQMYPQNNNFGIGILSKIPMISEVTDMGKEFPPSVLGELQVNGRPVSILATHPVPPLGGDKFRFRNMQLEEITKLSKAENGNFILAGDLNTSSYSRHFQKLLKTGNLKDSRNGWGIASSWPSKFLPLRTTLDHILYKGEMKVIKRTTERNIGSDHLPVYMEIGF